MRSVRRHLQNVLTVVYDCGSGLPLLLAHEEVGLIGRGTLDLLVTTLPDLIRGARLHHSLDRGLRVDEVTRTHTTADDSTEDGQLPIGAPIR